MPLTRREFLTTSSALAIGAAVGPHLFASGVPQAPPSQAPAAQASPPTVFTPLRGNVGVFTGQGGTIGWLVAPEGVVIVDAQMAATAKTCLDGINDRSADRPIDCLFNTHHHGDHTGGNGIFRPVARKIVAHAGAVELQKAAAAKAGNEAAQVYADTVFTDEWSMRVGNEAVSAVHHGPAHTGGDSVVTFDRENVVHMGDLVFNRRMPVLDRPGGCRIEGWIGVLDKVMKEHQADTIYVFGHGKPGLAPTGSREDLALQRDFLAALLDRVSSDVKAGRSRDDVVKAVGELKGFAEHGPLTERVLTAAWEEVTGQP